MDRTDSKIDTSVTRARSRPVRCELLSKDGFVEGVFESTEEALAEAARLWPGEEQDSDRTGKGWDIQAFGAE